MGNSYLGTERENGLVNEKDVDFLEKRIMRLGCLESQEDKEKARTVLLMGMLEASGSNDIQTGELGFSCQILLKKLNYYNIPVKFKSNYGVAMLELLASGNPGAIQVLMISILKKVDKSKWLELSCCDILMALGETFPTSTELLTLWDKQKDCEGFNNVDTLEYWVEQLELI